MESGVCPTAVWAALLGVERTVIEAVEFDGDEETLERFRVALQTLRGQVRGVSTA